jgi:hypothetical protein
MTIAICFKCGSKKDGSFVICKTCGTRPIRDDDCIYSMLMTSHYFKETYLMDMGKDIKNGKLPNVEPSTWNKISEEFNRFKKTPTGQMLFGNESENELEQRELLIKDFDYILEKLSGSNQEIRTSLNTCIGVFNEYLVNSFGSIENFKKQNKKIKLDYLQKIKNAEEQFSKDKNFEFQVSSSIFAMILCSYIENDEELEKYFEKKLKSFFYNQNTTNGNENIKSIILCPKCQAKYKVPIGKILEVTCNKCKNVWSVKS